MRVFFTNYAYVEKKVGFTVEIIDTCRTMVFTNVVGNLATKLDAQIKLESFTYTLHIDSTVTYSWTDTHELYYTNGLPAGAKVDGTFTDGCTKCRGCTWKMLYKTSTPLAGQTVD